MWEVLIMKKGLKKLGLGILFGVMTTAALAAEYDLKNGNGCWNIFK